MVETQSITVKIEVRRESEFAEQMRRLERVFTDKPDPQLVEWVAELADAGYPWDFTGS